MRSLVGNGPNEWLSQDLKEGLALWMPVEVKDRLDGGGMRDALGTARCLWEELQGSV